MAGWRDDGCGPVTNPYAGFDPRNGWHWAWLFSTILLSPVVVVLLVSGPVGWFLLVYLCGGVAEFRPAEIEAEMARRAAIKHRRADAAARPGTENAVRGAEVARARIRDMPGLPPVEPELTMRMFTDPGLSEGGEAGPGGDVLAAASRTAGDAFVAQGLTFATSAHADPADTARVAKVVAAAVLGRVKAGRAPSRESIARALCERAGSTYLDFGDEYLVLADTLLEELTGVVDPIMAATQAVREALAAEGLIVSTGSAAEIAAAVLACVPVVPAPSRETIARALCARAGAAYFDSADEYLILADAVLDLWAADH